MNYKIFFLVNNLKEFTFNHLIEKYLNGISVTVGEALPQNTEEYTLIILWNFRRKLLGVSDKKNIVIFHGSDLPDGKGWAPIYYTLAKGLEFYTISCVFAGEEIDSGDIIVKAKFKVKDNYTATMIRHWDSEISIMLLKEILTRFDMRPLKGSKQIGEGSFYRKRTPSDSEIKIDSQIRDIIGHMRGCEPQHPAFFYYNKTKYYIYIEPDNKPGFPDDLDITFFL